MVIANPDKKIPLIVFRLWDVRNKTARLATGSSAFHLVPITIEFEVVALLHRSHATHGVRVRLRRAADEARSVILG
ncbi:hypothetical protein D3C84_1016610 [compost metagenome]